MAIVPAASLQEVLRSITDDVEAIEVLFDETQVRFRMGEVEVTSKLMDGSFPDYRQLIPQQTEVQVELKRDELMRITKLAAGKWEGQLLAQHRRNGRLLRWRRWRTN